MLTLMISSRNKIEYKEVVDTQGQAIIDCSITGDSFLSTLGGRESFLKHDIERSKTSNNEIRTNSFEEIMPNLKDHVCLCHLTCALFLILSMKHIYI